MTAPSTHAGKDPVWITEAPILWNLGSTLDPKGNEDTLTAKMETLKRWAYTDGTVFYIDRTGDELEHGKRRCLAHKMHVLSFGTGCGI